MVFAYYSGFGVGAERCFKVGGDTVCMPTQTNTPADVQRAAFLDLAKKACDARDPVGAATVLREAQAAKLISLSIVDICAFFAGRPQPTPVTDVSKPDMELVRREQERVLRTRLPSISVEDLQGIVAAIDAGQGYKDSRHESLAPFRALFVEELQRRAPAPIPDQPQPVESGSAAIEASTGTPEKSNAGLYVGLGVAAVAAYFIFGRK
jgi:hypothetical protein